MLDLCAIGDLTWLVTLNLEAFPQRGGSAFLLDVHRGIGNDAAIVAAIAARGGLSTQLRTNPVDRVGAEPLVDFLTACGVDCHLLDRNAQRTPTTYCLRDPKGERTWLPMDGGFSAENILALPVAASFAYIDLYIDALLERRKAMMRAADNGVRLFVNLSAEPTDLQIDAVRTQPGLKVLQVAYDPLGPDPVGYGERLLAKTRARAVFVTLAQNGSVLITSDGIQRLFSSSVAVMRSTGAGAAFSAGALMGLVRKHGYEDAHALAVSTAATFCSAKVDPLHVVGGDRT